MIFYRKKYNEEDIIIADHVPAYFIKLYGEEVPTIFNPYYQDLSKEAQWK